MRALLLGLAACAGLNGLLWLSTPATPPISARDPMSLKLQADSAVETAAFFGLGMRRLSADLNLIRLLVYYGSPDEASEEDEHHHHEPFDPNHPELSWGGGRYLEIGPRAKSILDIDPSFYYAAIYSAGALAFNLNRPDEALEVLEYGLRKDPRNIQYRIYIAAVGFHRRGNTTEALRLLEPALADPDCPTMIKSMAAFLYKRAGQRLKAARLYAEIIQTTRDEGYRQLARRALKELGGGD